VTEEVAHLLLCAAELCRVTGHLAPAQSISSAVVDWAIEHGAADAQATTASNMPSVVELLMAYGVQGTDACDHCNITARVVCINNASILY